MDVFIYLFRNQRQGEGKAKAPRRHRVRRASQTDLHQLTFSCRTYSIGKERIAKGVHVLFSITLGWPMTCVIAIAKSLNSKIYCDARKAAILRCQADQELDALLTSDPIEGFVHLVPLGTITTDRLKIYLERFSGHYSKVIGFRPTGWTYVQFC